MAFGGIETGTSVAKARGPGNAMASRQMADIVNALSGAMQRNRRDSATTFAGVPLPRDPRWQYDTFGPGWPLVGEPLDAPRRDTGQPDPRLEEYPVTWNVNIGRDRHISWETLLQASESPLFRACIELRKTEISSLDWTIRVKPDVAAAIARKTGQYEEDVAKQLRSQYQAEIDRASAFWEVPDRKNGREWAEWISICMEEQLVWDALAVYPRMTYGGDLLDLWVIDGSTIMPLRDETGGRPEAPYPAFQQILYGFPRGEYTAVTFTQNGQDYAPGGLTAGQLVYKRRWPRSRGPYGHSPTEQALMDGMLYNKRFQWMLAEYTEGTMPAQLMESDGQLDWTPSQVKQYESDFNHRYSGSTAERMRFPFLPPGLRPASMTQVPERYKADYDLHLVKLVAMHYGTTISELGFTETGGLGSAGFHEGQEDINWRRGRLPDLRWFADFCTTISRTHLGLPAELEFTFLGLDQEDEAAADALDQNRLESGRMTLNETRAKLGLPAYDFAEADMPMEMTARGVVFLQGASQTAPNGVLIEPASEPNSVMPPGGIGHPVGGSSPTARRPIGPGGGGVSKEAAAAAELLSFRRWAAKRPDPARPFRFEHLDAGLAARLGVTDLLDDERCQLADF